MKKTYPGWLIILLGISACLDQRPDQLDFLEVRIQTFEAADLNSVRIIGQLSGQGATLEGDCGFIWSYDREAVEENRNDIGRIILSSLPPLSYNGEFEATLDDLERARTVFFRAFARARDAEAGERIVWSEKIESFTVGEIVALTGVALIFNDSATVYGQLRGVKGANVDASEHGHVISETNPMPALGCGDCRAYNNGPSNDDNVFDSAFPGLKFNTTYHVRAYAIAGADTFYSVKADTFRVRDGWKRITDFPYPYAEGAAAAVNGKAYAGFGCKKSNGCMPGDLVRDFWAFDPAGQSGSGEWTKSADVSPFITNRYNASAFALGDVYYAIFGEYFENGESNPLRDFCKFDITTNAWTADLPFAGARRTGAVTFVINGKAYAGLGRDANYNEFNDFWEYNLLTNTWRQVAGMPLRLSPLDNSENIGRYEAAAFVINGYAYVGSGQWRATALRDFWRFRPPANDQDPGEWTPAAFLPPEAIARYQAVAFSIGEKGYVGTGYHPTEGYLKDFWEYDPITDKWNKKTPLPGSARTNAMGFALDGYGYLGAGQIKVPVNGGLSYTELSLSDFWRYIPETK